MQGKTRAARDVLPDNFETLDELWGFWDTHSSADYEADMARLPTCLAPATLDAAIELAASRTTARRFRLRSQGADLAVAPHEDPEPVQRWLATVAALPPDAPPPLDAAGAHG